MASASVSLQKKLPLKNWAWSYHFTSNYAELGVKLSARKMRQLPRNKIPAAVKILLYFGQISIIHFPFKLPEAIY